MRRFGLRAQFLSVTTGLLIVIFTVLTISVINYTTNNLRTTQLDQARDFAALATKPIGETFVTYKDSGQIKIKQQIDKFTDLDPIITNVAIYSVTGENIFNQNNSPPPTASPEQMQSFDIQSLRDSTGAVQEIISPYIEDNGVHRYSIIYNISNAAISRSVSSLIRIIVTVSLVALVATMMLIYILVNRLLLRPVQEVSRMALSISRGNLNQAITLHRHDEIADLATATNTMADSLKRDIVRLRETDALKSEFMMLVSHNLRTPIATLNGYLELMSDQPLTPELKRTLALITASTRRLHAFAEDILTISSIEAGQGLNTAREATDISVQLETMGHEFAPVAEDKGLTFHAEIEPNVIVAVSAAQFRQAVWNVLDNALKFTQRGLIRLQLERFQHEARIVITDTGVGIAPAELDRLFTKFHRGTGTLDYNYEGSGLGLYVSKVLIDYFGGSIEGHSQQDHGSTFTIHLPLLQSVARQPGSPDGQYEAR